MRVLKNGEMRFALLLSKNFESVLATFPGSAVAWQNLGEIYMIMEEYEQAIKSYVNAFNAQTNANSQSSVDTLIKTYETLPAADSLPDLDAICQGPVARDDFSRRWCYDLLVLLSKAYMRYGDFSHVRKLLSVVEQLEKHYEETAKDAAYDLVLLQAECCYHLGEYKEALQILEDFVEINTRSIFQTDLEKVRARCLKEMEQVEEAARIVGRLYYFESPWNEKLKSENLKLWKEIVNAGDDEE